MRGKAVIVTGACGGLGRAFAAGLLDAGADVLATDLSTTALRELVTTLGSGAAGRIHGRAHDISGLRAPAELVETTLNMFGRVDGLVNNAAAFHEKSILEEDGSEMRALMQVNALGPMALGIEAAREMARAGSGSIVNIVSGAAQGIESMATYGASKGALLSATYGWALDLADYGVRVNALSPRANTSMAMTTAGARQFTADGRTPDRITPAIVYLLSDASMHVTGVALRFDGQELGLLGLPQIERFARDGDWWSVEDIVEQLDPLPAPFSAPGSMARMLEQSS